MPTWPQRRTGSGSGLGTGDVKNRGDYRRDRTNRLVAEWDVKADAQVSARSDLVDEQTVAEMNGVSAAERHECGREGWRSGPGAGMSGGGGLLGR